MGWELPRERTLGRGKRAKCVARAARRSRAAPSGSQLFATERPGPTRHCSSYAFRGTLRFFTARTTGRRCSSYRAGRSSYLGRERAADLPLFPEEPPGAHGRGWVARDAAAVVRSRRRGAADTPVRGRRFWRRHLVDPRPHPGRADDPVQCATAAKARSVCHQASTVGELRGTQMPLWCTERVSPVRLGTARQRASHPTASRTAAASRHRRLAGSPRCRRRRSRGRSSNYRW